MSQRNARPTTQEWADLSSLLAECLKRPDETFVRAVREGLVAAELRDHATALDLSVATDLEPPEPESVGALDESYTKLFEAMATPYAPPAESPYREWFGGRDGGLLGGPPAVEMRRRYEALGAAPPPAYPADHVALLLEYASVLLEHGEHDAYAAFVADHLNWLPALRAQVDRAAADAPFYRWAVALVDDVVAAVRDRLDIPHPDAATTETMVDRLAGDRDR